MAKSSFQKLKILYLMKILLENTDEEHGINMSDILAALRSYGISAERRSIYSDIEALRQYGLDIAEEQCEGSYYYRVVSRDFELPELKLLVDSVQAAKFITEKKSKELIKKIETLASIHEARLLNRHVYVEKRNKADNEKIYINVDQIHDAINKKCKIAFHYFQWDENKQKKLHKNGALYEVSPWGLLWADENYYLIAYDSAENKIKHFRVDKILDIEIRNQKRDGKEIFRDFEIPVYKGKMFGMFGGQEYTVRLVCENNLAGVMIDRFGRDVFMLRRDEEHFILDVKVAVSRQFLGWIIALGEGVKIEGPEDVVAMMRGEVKRLVGQYGSERGNYDDF